ncbi:MAG: VCBS repeat-containing protein [Candidatus Azobacteroides sp.]|nr:VCBS repeat-containing protein [Candidatus Azobacteroides sp.]
MKKQFSYLYLTKTVFIFCMAAVFCNRLPAQGSEQLKANVDNVFVEPGQTMFWDVLNNDFPGDCSPGGLTVSILQPPTRATLWSVNAANQIRYRAVTNYLGKDSLIYQIECNAGGISLTSSAKVYVNIGSQPDNMFTNVCYAPIPEIDWQIKQSAISAELVPIAITPLTGDVDGDGNIEIVTMNYNADSLAIYQADEILIFGYDEALTNPLFVKYRIPIPTTSTISNPMAIANVDGNKYASVFLVTTATSGSDAGVLIKYSFDGASWGESWRVPYTIDYSWKGGTPVVADFAGTGKAQVVVFDKVFNAQDGTLLVDGGFFGDGNSGYNFGRIPHYGSISVTDRFPSYTAADIDNDGILEIIGGNCVYKINISNPDALDAGNTYTLFQTAPEVGNGAIGIADMDGDGFLDVVVTWRVTPNTNDNGRMAVYNPRTGALLSSVITGIPTMNGLYGPSVPFIGDITGNGHPEIVFTGCNIMEAYAYNPALPVADRLTLLWTLPTTDVSASTTMSLFDFNQDGISELIYRDETDLRIINGSMKSHVTGNDTIVYNLASFNRVRSTTLNEYPIVADVNGDGAAEIITTGHTSATNWSGYLRVFASAGVPWASTRNVWDNFYYNPVYINDDLTVPRHPINPATIFYDEDTGTQNRPFNNFLQQATMLNEEGRMLYLVPDLRFSSFRPTLRLNEVLNRLEVTMQIGNDGDAKFTGPLDVKTYVYDGATGTYTLINATLIDTDLEINEYKTLTYYIPDYSGIVFPPYDRWLIYLNAVNNGSSEPTGYATTEECRFWNNYSANVSFSHGERVMCQGSIETLCLTPADTYRYEWFDSGGRYLQDGDCLTVTKDASPDQYYLVNAYTKDGNKLLTQVPDTAHVYLAPDSLVWTGSGGTRDWHDPLNWYNPDAPVPDPYPNASIPRKCTDVLIPDGLTIYPDLSDLSTDYTDYRSECANIHFKHGGEVTRTDSLDYDAAYVELVLNGNRMYMLSAPLRSFYPGDYYVTNPNPFKDNYGDSLFVYTYLWSRTNPETAKYIDGDWTGAFNNPEYPIGPGVGLGVWVDDLQPLGVHQPDTFNFPKHDPTYTMYDRDGNPKQTRNTPRPAGTTLYGVNAPTEHLFIYEPVLNRNTGDVRLDVSASGTDKQALVGNPFMAHLDFDAFYAMNSSKIMNYYRVTDENGNIVSYTAGGTSTGAVNRYIAPMQSFLVTAKGNFSELYANVEMTASDPGERLRSSGEKEERQILSVEVYRNGKSNKSLLILSPSSSNLYEEDRDVVKAFTGSDTTPVSVYTVSSDGMFLDVNYSENPEDLIVPLGIRTSEKGTFRLNFGGLTSFASGYDIFLNETSNGNIVNRYNLRNGSIHEFEKTDGETFVTDRFYLSFVKEGTDIRNAEAKDPGIESAVAGGILRVFTTDGSPLYEVTLYDLQGRMITSRKGINAPEVRIPLLGRNICIVRATGQNTSRSMKIYAR